MKSAFKEVSLRLIDSCGNPRSIHDPAKDTALAANIKQNGVLHPITVAPMNEAGLYELVCGGRRLAALLSAGCETSIVQVLDSTPTAVDKLLMAVSENENRDDLHACDFLRSIDQFVAAGWTGAQLAKRLGAEASTVSRWMTVSRNATPEVRERIRAGTLSLAAAYDLCRVGSDAQQALLAGEPSDTLLTRDALAHKIRRIQRRQRVGRSGAVMNRITTRIGRAKSITFSGRDLTLETLVQWLGELLSRATRAQAQGMDLNAFARALKHPPAAPDGAAP